MFADAFPRQRPKDRTRKRGLTRAVLTFKAPIGTANEKVESLPAEDGKAAEAESLNPLQPPRLRADLRSSLCLTCPRIVPFVFPRFDNALKKGLASLRNIGGIAGKQKFEQAALLCFIKDDRAMLVVFVFLPCERLPRQQ